MVSLLYEALGVARDATPEEIRKAYRKKALQTHPDRLPPGASASDKSKAEEQFRKVNNAYEVLCDEEKRRVYDRYGEYPPPEPQADTYDRHTHRKSSRHRPYRHTETFPDPFDVPFFTQGFGGQKGNSFTDPFMLFESIFGDIRRQMNGSFFNSRRDPFSNSPFGHSSLFDRFMDPSFPMFSPSFDNAFTDQNQHNGSRVQTFTSHGVFSRNGDTNGQWISQSQCTRTVNGVTESVYKRTDSNGNEHVTYSYPDGRQRHLINGVEQQQQQLQQNSQQQQQQSPSSHRHRRRSSRVQTEDVYAQPPPPYPGPPAHHSSRGQARPVEGPYNSANIKHDMERERHHRERFAEDTRAHDKKTWW